jgi:hypothetical protein
MGMTASNMPRMLALHVDKHWQVTHVPMQPIGWRSDGSACRVNLYMKMGQ